MASSSQSSSSQSKPYLSDLKDGANYHVIPGKHAKSKLIIKGDHAFTVDKKVPLKEETGKVMYYVRCKFKDCKVRGWIKNDFLTVPENSIHTCVSDGLGASKAKWLAQAALSRMRERAAKETSSFDVSVYL